MMRLGVLGSVLPAEPAFAPVSVSGMGSVRVGMRRRCASADCVAASRASSTRPVTARTVTPRQIAPRTIGLF
jgi:hypothetical protein